MVTYMLLSVCSYNNTSFASAQTTLWFAGEKQKFTVSYIVVCAYCQLHRCDKYALRAEVQKIKEKQKSWTERPLEKINKLLGFASVSSVYYRIDHINSKLCYTFVPAVDIMMDDSVPSFKVWRWN